MERVFRIVLMVFVGILTSCDEKVETVVLTEYDKQGSIYETYREGEIGPDGMYRAEDGNFLVKFPGPPEFTSEVLDTQVGKVRYDMYVYKESETQSFMVSISEFPTKHIKNQGAEKILENAFQGALKSLENSSIYDDRAYTMNGLPAKRLKAKGEIWHVSAEMFVVNNRLYQVTILRDGSFPDERVEREFIESFYIMERNELQ